MFFGYISLMIALVNLAPVAPLDGATAWRLIPILWSEIRGNSTSKLARKKRRF